MWGNKKNQIFVSLSTQFIKFSTEINRKKNKINQHFKGIFNFSFSILFKNPFLIMFVYFLRLIWFHIFKKLMTSVCYFLQKDTFSVNFFFYLIIYKKTHIFWKKLQTMIASINHLSKTFFLSKKNSISKTWIKYRICIVVW